MCCATLHMIISIVYHINDFLNKNDYGILTLLKAHCYFAVYTLGTLHQAYIRSHLTFVLALGA